MYPQGYRYTKDHEWIAVEGDRGKVGITDYAQKQLGDVVFVELPKVGRQLKKAEAAAVVESVKAASDVYSPLAGTVLESNGALASAPEQINRDPYGAGWIMRIKPDDAGQLTRFLDAQAYAALIAAAAE